MTSKSAGRHRSRVFVTAAPRTNQRPLERFRLLRASGSSPLVTKILAPLLCYTAGCGLKAFFHHQPKVYEPFQRIGVHIIDGDAVLDSRLWTFGQYLL